MSERRLGIKGGGASFVSAKLPFEALPDLIPRNPVFGMCLGVFQTLIQELLLPVEEPVGNPSAG
jgi:hypothetical protein